jgi:hypothetical protein
VNICSLHDTFAEWRELMRRCGKAPNATGSAANKPVAGRAAHKGAALFSRAPSRARTRLAHSIEVCNLTRAHDKAIGGRADIVKRKASDQRQRTYVRGL